MRTCPHSSEDHTCSSNQPHTSLLPAAGDPLLSSLGKQKPSEENLYNDHTCSPGPAPHSGLHTYPDQQLHTFVLHKTAPPGLPPPPQPPVFTSTRPSVGTDMPEFLLSQTTSHFPDVHSPVAPPPPFSFP